MPEYTPVLGFPKPTGSEPTNGPGDIGRLADKLETYLVANLVPLLTSNSDQKVLGSDTSPTSTTNINLTALNMSVTVGSTSDVVWVDIDAVVRITTATTNNIIELLIDGVADAKLLQTEYSGTGRASGYKKWRLTGLTPGVHTIAFRTRNSATSTGATVVGSGTSASYRVGN